MALRKTAGRTAAAPRRRAKPARDPVSDERRFRDYAEAAADWFWEMDAALRFSYMSESTQLPDAAMPQLFVGRRLEDIASGGEETADRRSLTDLLDARLPFRDIRFTCRDLNGVVQHLSFSGLPVYAREGEGDDRRGARLAREHCGKAEDAGADHVPDHERGRHPQTHRTFQPGSGRRRRP